MKRPVYLYRHLGMGFYLKMLTLMVLEMQTLSIKKYLNSV